MENKGFRLFISVAVTLFLISGCFTLPGISNDNYVSAAKKSTKKTEKKSAKAKKIKVKFKARSGKFVKFKYKNAKGKKTNSIMKQKKVTTGKKYGTLAKVERAGYKFKGWYTKKHGGKKITKKSKVKAKKKQTLYAHWTPIKYTVSFDSKGGYNVASKKVKYRDDFGALPVPKRPGCQFIGWFTSRDNKIYATTRYTTVGDMTLYAGWHVGTMGVGSNYLETLGKTPSQIPGISINSQPKVYNGKTYVEYYDAYYNYYLFENGVCILVEGKSVMPNVPTTGINKIQIDSEYGISRLVYSDTGSDHKVFEYRVENTYIDITFNEGSTYDYSWSHISLYNYEYVKAIINLFS